ncbi:hypothetical protein [Phytoactinopolyspora endophytica]|uniref:hypothetical protein n=1 Tax=Phytoactinopolyspora endophytica TaxID=1642495 RepID=UPI00101C6B68|nr:hypothetical protein [Phytoactinopolyspora endophytica]
MKTPIKITAYGGVLGVTFAGALGIGSLTGSPIDRNEELSTHDTGHDSSDDADTDSHGSGDADGHGSGDAGGHGSGEAGTELPAGLQVSEGGYTLSAITAPESTDEQGTLSFSITGPDGEPVTEFTESHEKDLHLIVVRSDTTGYRHVHPTLDDDGTWSIDWEWASAGTYKVFADFEPTALGQGLTLARTFEVGGDHTPEPLSADSRVADVDGYTVTLAGRLVAGESAEVTATVERDGEPVTDLEPYLGAYGHLVALRSGDLAYLHVHPEGDPGDGVTTPGPEVRFAVETPTAGTYRLFLDFQIDGQVHTAEFTLTAADGGGDDDPGADTDGDGDDGSGADADGDGDDGLDEDADGDAGDGHDRDDTHSDH